MRQILELLQTVNSGDLVVAEVELPQIGQLIQILHLTNFVQRKVELAKRVAHELEGGVVVVNEGNAFVHDL